MLSMSLGLRSFSVLGAWPLDAREVPRFAERVRDYLIKASREAKQHSSWLQPDEEYERYKDYL